MAAMFDTLAGYFSYKFVMYALIVGVLVSLCSSLLGVTLVLRRFSMIGDGLSHVAFGALVIGTVLGDAPLAFAVPVVIVAAFFLLRISETARIGGDTAIAMISSASLAVGVIVISMTSGMNTDVTSYMFGSINSMEKSDVMLSVLLSAVVVILYVLFFNRIFLITFDESFAKATGMKTDIYKFAFSAVTAVTVVVGMRVIGAMLISALIIFPASSAMRVSKSFRMTAILSAVISVVCCFLGICVSCLFSFPTGASIVAVNAVCFLFFEAAALIAKR